MQDKQEGRRPHLFQEGHAKVGGRQKGTPNKTTALLKDAIIQAATAAGGGGRKGLVRYLTTQARENPGPFLALLGKVLPLQVSGDNDKPLPISRIEWVIVSPDGDVLTDHAACDEWTRTH
jgi:hypothetical protein